MLYTVTKITKFVYLQFNNYPPSKSQFLNSFALFREKAGVTLKKKKNSTKNFMPIKEITNYKEL